MKALLQAVVFLFLVWGYPVNSEESDKVSKAIEAASEILEDVAESAETLAEQAGIEIEEPVVIPVHESTHGVDLYGELKYGPDFKHFDYVNPDAPKGGDVTMVAFGSFDSFNPFVVKGTPAAGMSPLHPSLMYATLMMHSQDEAISSYCYVAKSVHVAEDRALVKFKIRKEAKFHDGSRIRPEDVIFSFKILKEKGLPFFKNYFREVIKAEKTGSDEVQFTFKDGDNKELAATIGEFPILSEKFYKKHRFEDASLIKPMGSGPYRIKKFDAGKSITYERVKNWWGEKLPVNVGRNNFQTMRYVYFRDLTVAFEAFKAGDIDVRFEPVSKIWATGYDIPAVKNGDIVKESNTHEKNQGFQGFAFNTRLKKFRDIRVRKALSLVFDFEWTNENLFYGLYKRTNSYFENSELAARGLPKGEELEILNNYKDKLPAEVFKTEFKMPVNDGSGTIRKQLRRAKNLLESAGYVISDGKLVDGNSDDKEPFEIEFLVVHPEFVRIINGYKRNLERLGIDVKIRVVDSAQYVDRMENFDFDMVVIRYGQSESPGNEQLEMWGSKAAHIPGGLNYMGIQNQVIDDLIEKLIDAPTRESLIQRTRALDRVLLANFYAVPCWYNNSDWIAYWNRFGIPEVRPKYGTAFDSWWIDAEKDKALQGGKKSPAAAKKKNS
ncbi:MAG: extracellular solute-binding protein [Alphaproteobacteria bacterium]